VPEPIYPDLTDAAERHLRLVCSLDRLADAEGESAQRLAQRRGDTLLLHRGDVVLVAAARRWRHGIVTELGAGHPCSVRVAYLAPTRLDAAQKTWTARSAPLLAPDYPGEAAAAARRRYGNDVTGAWQAGLAAYHEAVLTQTVAVRCARRPWAAVVPIQYVDIHTTNVYVSPNQDQRWDWTTGSYQHDQDNPGSEEA
jgi:hypothetical protein